jgi:hypothetical protein
MDGMAMGHLQEIESAGRRSQFPVACLTMLEAVERGKNFLKINLMLIIRRSQDMNTTVRV